MKIRFEEKKDYDDVRNIHLSAFDGSGEAQLVELLREKASPIISMVAEEEGGNVVGHIIFSPVTLCDHDIDIMGLAPVAIYPNYQKMGYGTNLIKKGLEECKKMGYQGVVLLGHADYYPRFGFKASIEYGISCEYDVPEENFMALELVEGAFSKVSGKIKYHSAFSEL
ncbi:MAG: N-acetyltransferase [Kordiimonadaceae bacterium]|jgi:putative acetyltransferase|nr:N-acetyltransferase [Kordiimonadaceae bacterium]MBT6030939.1 N-acetyltransferase [Kordiimonadaceae bacterium]